MKGGNRAFICKVKDPKVDYALFEEWKKKLKATIDSSEGVKN